jgi:hypothetical protein
MPEELAIALIVLVFVIWLIAVILKAIWQAAEGAHKAVLDHISNLTKARHLERKHRLSQYVSVLLPDQLDIAQHELRLAEERFRKVQAHTTWKALRPLWVQQEFVPYTLIKQNEVYGEMDIYDLRAILQPSDLSWLSVKWRSGVLR